MTDTCFAFDARMEAVDTLHAQTNFYTHKPIVNRLLDRVGWPTCEGRLLDPSAGDGSFLICALRRLRILPNDMEGAKRVRGCEIHPGAVAAARANITDELMASGWHEERARIAAGEIVIEADFLTDFATNDEFSVIAGNPPYAKYAHLPQFFQDLYSVAVVDYARADILHAFLDKCCAILPAGGRIAFVTADRWMLNSSAGRLREEIGRKVRVVHASRLDETTSFYRPKKERTAGAAPRVHPVEVVLSRSEGSVLSGEPFYVDDVSTASSGLTLNDIADVRMAGWAGKDSIFLVDQTVAERLAGARSVPAIDPDNIPADRDELSGPIRYLLLTSRKRGAVPSADVQAHVATATAAVLDDISLPERAKARAYRWKLCADRFITPEAMSLPLDRPGLVLPYICRRFRPIPFPAGMHPVNHLIAIYAKPGGPPLDEIATILRSDQSAAWLARIGRRIENGYFSFSIEAFRRMPVPRDSGFAVAA